MGEREPGAYAGLKVLDISQGFAGPYCAGILAAQGADVIKVEPPSGDWGRWIGTRHGDNTAFGMVGNAGKRCIGVDARTEAGRAVLARLAADTDILVQNFRAGVAERMGLGYADLSAANPKLIYVTVSGFGSGGAWAGRPATDTIIQGMSGLMRLNQDATGTPRKLAFTVVDAVAGVYAAQRTGTALFARERTGSGAYVEVSLLHAALALQAIPLLDRALGIAAGHEDDAAAPLAVPVGPFVTADGALNITCINDKQFAAICGVLGYDDWAHDPGLATVGQRAARFGEIQRRVAASMRERTTAEWTDAFTAADVLVGPIHDYRGVLEDSEIAGLGLLRRFDAAEAGLTVPMPRVPGSVHNPGDGPVRAPGYGEHTEQVLREAGWMEAEIAGLLASGAVLKRRPG